MKIKFLLFATVLGVLVASCSKEDEEKLTTKTETVRVVDTFMIDYTTEMTYSVTVLEGNTVSMGAGKNSSTVSGAVVTAVQGNTKVTQTTDQTGIVTFTGLFKGAIAVTISKDDYTGVSYIATANNIIKRDSTNKNQKTKVYVANQIPVFKYRNDPSTAKLIGRATYENDLTNTTREFVPENTVVRAYIDASDILFQTTYLKTKVTTSDVYGGEILQIAYSSFFYDSTDAQGNYEIVVPSAIAGLPFIVTAGDIVGTQKVFENTGVSGFNRTAIYRNIFSPTQAPSGVPAAGGAQVDFITGSGAVALASISGAGQIDRINILSGGTGYTSAPRVRILGGGGTGATATAVVTNGVVTAINLTNPGTGYTAPPTITISGGTGAAVSAQIGGTGSIIRVNMISIGSGYTSAPNVTLSAPSTPGGVNATATAVISNGNVIRIDITNAGTGYTTTPSVTIDPAPAGGSNATAAAQFSGFSVQSVNITNPGADYSGNPTVTFSDPNLSTGTRAQGIATVDVNSGQVIGFTITNPGSGYLVPPSATISSGTGASAEAIFSGRVLTGIDIINEGTNYFTAPIVRITGGGGSGATATAVVQNRKVVGLNITNRGQGYTSSPTVEFITGAGAQASVVVNDGKITAINIVNGGFNYNAAPIVDITPLLGGPGDGATATATVNADGQVTGVTITNPGAGYLGGNTPSLAEPFTITPSLSIDKIRVKPGGIYVRDIHYGTGLKIGE